MTISVAHQAIMALARAEGGIKVTAEWMFPLLNKMNPHIHKTVNDTKGFIESLCQSLRNGYVTRPLEMGRNSYCATANIKVTVDIRDNAEPAIYYEITDHHNYVYER